VCATSLDPSGFITPADHLNVTLLTSRSTSIAAGFKGKDGVVYIADSFKGMPRLNAMLGARRH
jgi:hypothetical protein